MKRKFTFQVQSFSSLMAKGFLGKYLCFAVPLVSFSRIHWNILGEKSFRFSKNESTKTGMKASCYVGLFEDAIQERIR